MKIAIFYITTIAIWIIITTIALSQEEISFTGFLIVMTVLFINMLGVSISLWSTVRIITAVKSIINQLTNVKED